MKIAFFVDTFFPYISGVTISLTNAAKVLAKYGHKIIIFAPSPAKKSQKLFLGKGIKIEFLPSIKTFYHPNFRIGAPTPKSLLKLKKFNPDIIHIHSPLLIGGEGLMGAKLLKKPCIFSFHTYYMNPDSLKIFGINKPIKTIEKALWSFTKVFTKNIKVIIAPTDFVAKDLQKHQFTNRIEVLASGIERKLYFSDEKRKQALKKELDLSGKIILGVGRLSREKSWEFLLGAMKILYGRGVRCTLVLIGNGQAQDNLRFLAQVLGIEHRVRFLGEISHEQLISKGYYRLGDVFVMPSSWETQGLVTLEAMGFGLPIVAVRSKGSVALVGEHGLLVRKNENDFAKAILKVLTDDKFSQYLSDESVRRANDFCLTKLTRKLEGIYQSCLG